MRCKSCVSYAINPHLHGRDNTDLDLCDVCYWRIRAQPPVQGDLEADLGAIQKALTIANKAIDRHHAGRAMGQSIPCCPSHAAIGEAEIALANIAARLRESTPSQAPDVEAMKNDPRTFDATPYLVPPAIDPPFPGVGVKDPADLWELLDAFSKSHDTAFKTSCGCRLCTAYGDLDWNRRPEFAERVKPLEWWEFPCKHGVVNEDCGKCLNASAPTSKGEPGPNDTGMIYDPTHDCEDFCRMCLDLKARRAGRDTAGREGERK